MKHILTFVAVAIMFAGCAPEESTAIRDGLTRERAIVINVKRQMDIPAAERAWIEKHLPGTKLATSSTAKPVIVQEDGSEIIQFGHLTSAGENGEIYSSLLVVLPDGTERMVHFDITSAFGKFDK